MRILPGLAYNDMKRILAGFFSMAGKSTPAPGRLLFDGREEYPGPWPASFRWQGRVPRPLAGFSSMAGKNAPAAVRGSFPPDFPMYKEVSIPRLLPGGSS